MTTLKTQTDAKVNAGRQANPEFMKSVDDIIAQAKTFKEGANAIKIEQTAPDFELPDAQGNAVSLANLLKEGPVVVTFYRGSWCPYCNLQLRALQENLAEINSLGATLIAISPQMPDDSLTESDINNMEFAVLSDQDANVASQYGVAWKVPEFLMEHMRVDRKLDFEKIHNGNTTILPIPATFVLDRNGKVVWRFVDVDYRARSEPSDIINVLKTLS